VDLVHHLEDYLLHESPCLLFLFEEWAERVLVQAQHESLLDPSCADRGAVGGSEEFCHHELDERHKFLDVVGYLDVE